MDGMSSSVEELVKGLGEATGLEQTNAKALTSKLLETMEPPLKTVKLSLSSCMTWRATGFALGQSQSSKGFWGGASVAGGCW